MNRLALRATGLIAAAWLLAACPVQPNGAYCETDSTCGSDQLCDLQGMFGDGTRNVCVLKRDCVDDDACTSPGTPICETGIQTCRQCRNGDECAAKDPNAPACVDGMCVTPACSISSECPPSAPICGGTECVLCTADAAGDAACAARANMPNTPNTPYCTPTGTCGVCKSNNDCTTAEDGPICNVDTGTCRPCEANDECASGVCDQSNGQCAAPGTVLYVDGANGDDASTCDSVDNACKTIGAALGKVADAYQYVHIASGAYGEVLTIDGIPVTLVGDGVSLQPDIGQTNTPVITIQNGAEVTIQGLRITGASSGSNADGIDCKSGSSVSLSRVTVAENAALGVDANACTLVIERSTIAKNTGGGLSIRDSAFTVTNSFIVENGNGVATLFGGVKIDNAAALSPQRFDFNTVARNQAQAIGDATGVRCSTATPMTASSNIVYGGAGGPPSIDGSCAWKYSNIEGGPTNNNNIDADPGFASSGTDEDDAYHLQATSPLRDAGDPNTGITIDFDGDSRPQGDAPDIGADELPPSM